MKTKTSTQTLQKAQDHHFPFRLAKHRQTNGKQTKNGKRVKTRHRENSVQLQHKTCLNIIFSKICMNSLALTLWQIEENISTCYKNLLNTQATFSKVNFLYPDFSLKTT